MPAGKAEPLRIVALMTVRNEALVLARSLQHLAGQGVETCLVDHGSDDETLQIAESFLGRGVFRIERLAYDGVFSLEAQLRQKERLAAEIDADWFIHLDADEIREGPESRQTLHAAITEADRGGWNAIDFDEFVFVPTSDDERFEGRDFVADMRWYYYFEPESPDRFRINAWRKQPDVDLHTHGGHQAVFPGRRVCPRAFVMRHYLALSRDHARQKYNGRRFASTERARQWHSDRARFDAEGMQWPDRSRLKYLEPSGGFDRSDPWRRHFWDEAGRPEPPSILQAFKASQGDRVPTIAPVDGGARPFWSVMMPTFNPDPSFLRDALAGVLAQDSGPDRMQIEVVDDGSRVDVAAIVAEVGRGRVVFTRQPDHVGMVRNWNSCVERARGQWVHLLHQDDRVLPGFYARLERPCGTIPNLVAAWCRGAGIDQDGKIAWVQEPERPDAGLLVDFVRRIAAEQRIVTPAIVVRRGAYEAIGGYHLDLPYCADWDFYKRLAVHGAIWYEPASLACWRQHGSSTSAKLTASGGDLADRRRSIELSKAYLPADCEADATPAARRAALLWAADVLRDSLLRGDVATALTQGREIVSTLEPVADRASASPVPLPGEIVRLRAQIDELEAQLAAWMRAAQRLAGSRATGGALGGIHH